MQKDVTFKVKDMNGKNYMKTCEHGNNTICGKQTLHVTCMYS